MWESKMIYSMNQSYRWGAVKPQYGKWQNAELYLHVFLIFLFTNFYLYAHSDLRVTVCVRACVCVCECVRRRRMERRRAHWRPRPLWNWSLSMIPTLKTRSTTPPVQSRFLQTSTKAVSTSDIFVLVCVVVSGITSDSPIETINRIHSKEFIERQMNNHTEYNF